MSEESWVSFWGADPRPWLRTSAEPTARWLCLTELDDPLVRRAQAESTRRLVVADPAVQTLIGRLPDWRSDAGASGHHAPAFAPNMLHLLADLGLRAGDDMRIERLLDQLLAHQDADGRFESFGRVPGIDEPVWGSLACDTHAVTEVMVRYGRMHDARVQRSLEYMAARVTSTAQGPGWACTPHTVSVGAVPAAKETFAPK